MTSLLHKHAPHAERIGFELGRWRGGYAMKGLIFPWFASTRDTRTQLCRFA
jgi:hypothetical protein